MMIRFQVLPFVLALGMFGPTGAYADPHPKGFEPHQFNGSVAPVTENGVTTFRIEDEACSTVDFGDGRGESDCLNGTVRSNFSYSPDGKVGQALEYRFDVRVDPSIEYEGYLNPDAAGFEPGAWDSLLWLASWEGTFLHNFIYILKASKKTGITFAGEVCQLPENLGDWVTFSMKVKWGGDDKAWIAVTCDDRYVYVSEGAPSNVAPDCYIQNQCVPGEVRDPKWIVFIPGLKLSGWGHGWQDMGKQSQFIPIQEDGITAQMRNLSVTPDPVLYGPEEKALVVDLQNALNGLGCDVGTADGVPGKRTREAALTCRKFADATMPAQLNVATVRTFVSLYSQDNIAELPPGELPSEPLVIHAFQLSSENDDPEGQVVTTLKGTVKGSPNGTTELEVLLIGEMDTSRNRFEWLHILMVDDIGQAGAVAECEGARVEDWGDGGVHAVLQFDETGGNYRAQSSECVLAALPEDNARGVDFVLTHFKEIAGSMVADGTLSGVTHPGLRAFIDDVASGAVTVGK